VDCRLLEVKTCLSIYNSREKPTKKPQLAGNASVFKGYMPSEGLFEYKRKVSEIRTKIKKIVFIIFKMQQKEIKAIKQDKIRNTKCLEEEGNVSGGAYNMSSHT
jgi:hypothetical protein